VTESRPERDDDGSVDVEAAWADIIAHWDDGVDTDRTHPTVLPPASLRQPDVGKPDVATPDAAEPDGAMADGNADGEAEDDEWADVRSRVGGDRVRDAALRDAEVDEAGDDEGYVPPEPPPLPRGDAVSRLAWAGVLGAPLFFMIAALFWRDAPTVLIFVAVAAFVAGFAALVVRMPDRRDGGDDDGARV
jgi:hypothetical protein